MLRSLEFVKTTEQYNQTIEEDEKDFVYIAKILTKTLGWKLTQKIEADCLLWSFQKNHIEIMLIYDNFDGMSLRTRDDNFPLQELFDEINAILKTENA